MGILRNSHAGVLCLVLLLLNVFYTVAQPTSLLEEEPASILQAFDGLPDCAVVCVVDSVKNSTCSLNDVDCICSDEGLSDSITTCVTASCSVRDQLTTKNITFHFCGVPVDADDEIVPIFAVFITLTLVAVGFRVVARVLTKAYFWWDDLCNLFALVGCIAFTAINIKEVDYGFGLDIWWVRHEHITLILKMFYVDMLLYTITRFFVRASIILFYLRVFPATSETNLRPIVIWTMAANVVYNLAFLFAVIFQCQPISYFWTQWEGLHDGHCGNVNVLAWVAAISGLAFDFWLLALPFPQLMSLNVHWKKKAMGGVMFSVGASVMVISLVRLKSINEFTRAVNPTKDIVQVCLWSGIEMDVGVICPCLPSFRLLLRKMWPRLVGTSAVGAGQNAKYEMRSRSNTAGSTSRNMVRRISTVRSSIMGKHSKRGSRDSKGSGAKGKDNSRSANIIKTTEVGVEFEIVRPGTVASSRGGESVASVTALVDSDGESIHHGIHHQGHGRGNDGASFV